MRNSGTVAILASLLMVLCISIQDAIAATAVAPKRQAFQTTDGVLLVGDVYAQGSKAPTIILWHMLGRNRTDFQPFIPLLLAKGFSVVNMDQRGHGESIQTTGKSKIDFKTFNDDQWKRLPSDALLVIQDIQRLHGVNGNNIGIVGASIGANMAALASSDKHVKAVVLLSPGFDYHGMKPESAIRASTKPVFMVAAKPDNYSFDAIGRWANKKPNLTAAVVPERAHGDDLLKNESIVDQIMHFLTTNMTTNSTK